MNHNALLKTVKSCGVRLVPMSVHFVTLLSNPNLYSWTWLVVVSMPLNHNALLKTVKSFGDKPVPMLVHFVTLPSTPNLYS